MNLNKQAFTGLSDNYEKARPRYPLELYKALLDQYSVHNRINHATPATLTIADVGCGTGISTRALHSYVTSELSKTTVVSYGVEPGVEMRNTAISKTDDKQIQYMDGSAENIPVESESIDIVTAAQAAHWFNRPVFYKEVDRVLKRGGILAIYENNRDNEHSKFLDAYESFLETYAYQLVEDDVQEEEGDKSGSKKLRRVNYSRHYRNYAYDTEMKEYFGNCSLFEFQWERVMNASDFVTMAKSSSQANKARKNMGEDMFEKELREIINQYKDVNTDTLVIPYRTKLHVSAKN